VLIAGGIVMILYHFTTAERAERIAKEGLLPASDISVMVGGAEVVWLTERVDLSATPAETAECFRRSGKRMTQWFVIHDPRPVRLTVRIPTHDRKLFEHRPWLRKHYRPGMPHHDSCFLPHWIYFGVIPTSKIVEVTDVVIDAPMTRAA
jgi:hypothetical protein